MKSAYYQVPIAEEDRPYTAFEAGGKLYQYCRLPFGLTNGVSAFQRIIDSLIQQYKLKRTYAYLNNITVAGETQEEHDLNLKAFLDAAAKAKLTFNKNKSTFSVPVINVLEYRISHGVIKPEPEPEPVYSGRVARSQDCCGAEKVRRNVCLLRSLD